MDKIIPMVHSRDCDENSRVKKGLSNLVCMEYEYINLRLVNFCDKVY